MPRSKNPIEILPTAEDSTESRIRALLHAAITHAIAEDTDAEIMLETDGCAPIAFQAEVGEGEYAGEQEFNVLGIRKEDMRVLAQTESEYLGDGDEDDALDPDSAGDSDEVPHEFDLDELPLEALCELLDALRD